MRFCPCFFIFCFVLIHVYFFSTLLFNTQNLPKSGLSLSSLILMWQKNFASMLHYLTLFQQYAFYWYYSNVLGKSTQWFLQPVQILLCIVVFFVCSQINHVKNVFSFYDIYFFLSLMLRQVADINSRYKKDF